MSSKLYMEPIIAVGNVQLEEVRLFFGFFCYVSSMLSNCALLEKIMHL